MRRIVFMIPFMFLGLPAVAEQGFVRVQGDQFVCNGQVYKLKGTNYYPKNHMWASMWSSWDWPEIQTEATMIKNLGLNCVRILVPYSYGGWNGPNPPADRLQMLEDLVNLLGQKGVRSCVTLFDWETTFPAKDTPTEANHLSYISAIVGRLKNNKYVFMWDVKNEPDHPSNIGGYDDWDYAPTQKAKIISWLSRMCAAVRAIDTNHPVSAGLRWYNNVSDVISFVDVAIFHSYWRLTINTVQIPTVKAAMGGSQKPILVEEFGWPTNPVPCYRDGVYIYDYTETEQVNLYTDHFNAFVNHNTAGGLQWMTFDAKPYTSNPNESFENYFGLWKYDYSLKPGGVYYRDHYPVNLFPVEPDTTPPAAVTSFTASGGDGQVYLTWKNPSDYDFKGTLVRYKTTGYPSSISDGYLVCNRAASPGTTDSYTHTGLLNGMTYYYAAFAYDAQPNYSAAAQTSAVPQKVKCSYVKLLPDGTLALLNGKSVTGVFASEGFFYVEEPDRSSGIRVVVASPTVVVGDVVAIVGTVTTRKPDGTTPSERQITATSVTKLSSGTALPPMTMNCLAVGGAAIPPYVPGVNGGVGLNNIGLLIRIAGRVTAVVSNYVWVDDGSNILDPTGRIGVMVRCPSTSIPVAVGDTVVVTGIVEGSIPVGWTTNRRCLRIRTFGDVVKV